MTMAQYALTVLRTQQALSAMHVVLHTEEVFGSEEAVFQWHEWQRAELVWAAASERERGKARRVLSGLRRLLARARLRLFEHAFSADGRYRARKLHMKSFRYMPYRIG